MKNNNSKLNTVLLMIVIVLLGAVLITLVGEKTEQKGDLTFNPTEQTEKKISDILTPKNKTVNIKLGPFTNEDNGKTFNINKGDIIVVDSGTYTDGGYKAEDIIYDKSMLNLQNHSFTKCDPLATGCSISDIFKFIAIKEGTTIIKRSHYRFSSDTEGINLMVTLKID